MLKKLTGITVTLFNIVLLITLNIMHMESNNQKENYFLFLSNTHFSKDYKETNSKLCWKGQAYLKLIVIKVLII